MVSVHDTFEVDCSLNYQDPEGDIKTLDFEYTVPDLTVHQGEEIPLSGVLGVTEGKANFNIYVKVTVPGEYLVRIWLVDEKGNKSNSLEGNITARQ